MGKLHEFNHLKPSDYYQYHQVLTLESLHFAHPVYVFHPIHTINST